MENTTEIYKIVFKKYSEILRHHELNTLRLEIKTWLKNEREGNINEMQFNDLILLIHNALLFKVECDIFSELIEIGSFNINVDEFLILENELRTILCNLNFNSNINLSEFIDKINNSRTIVRNQISKSYVRRNFNDVISELFDLDLNEMINSNPTKIRNLLNESLYLDKIESNFSPLIKECRILLITIIKFIKNDLHSDPNYPPPYHLLDHLISIFKEKINLLKMETSAANNG